jgi:hypothetical protein
MTRPVVNTPRLCACGGLPQFANERRRGLFGRGTLERLVCMQCGNATAARPSRQLLRADWNLYVFRAGRKPSRKPGRAAV